MIRKAKTLETLRKEELLFNPTKVEKAETLHIKVVEANEKDRAIRIALKMDVQEFNELKERLSAFDKTLNQEYNEETLQTVLTHIMNVRVIGYDVRAYHENVKRYFDRNGQNGVDYFHSLYKVEQYANIHSLVCSPIENGIGANNMNKQQLLTKIEQHDKRDRALRIQLSLSSDDFQSLKERSKYFDETLRHEFPMEIISLIRQHVTQENELKRMVQILGY